MVTLDGPYINIPSKRKRKVRGSRPPPCPEPQCRHPDCSWNGDRRVQVVERDESGNLVRSERIRDRGRCGACHSSFTIYEDGHYPRRQYQLDAVATVVSEIVVGLKSARQTAERFLLSLSSVYRWPKWTGQFNPVELLSLTQKLMPEVPAATGISMAGEGVAAQVLHAMECLGSALVECGERLKSYSGLGRVLEWQHRRHKVIFRAAYPMRCHLSPAMTMGNSCGSG